MLEDLELTLRTVDADGSVRETKLTPAQALDLGAGKPVTFFPRNETIGIDEDGQVVHGEDAPPQCRDAA